MFLFRVNSLESLISLLQCRIHLRAAAGTQLSNFAEYLFVLDCRWGIHFDFRSKGNHPRAVFIVERADGGTNSLKCQLNFLIGTDIVCHTSRGINDKHQRNGLFFLPRCHLKR